MNTNYTPDQGRTSISSNKSSGKDVNSANNVNIMNELGKITFGVGMALEGHTTSNTSLNNINNVNTSINMNMNNLNNLNNLTNLTNLTNLNNSLNDETKAYLSQISELHETIKILKNEKFELYEEKTAEIRDLKMQLNSFGRSSTSSFGGGIKLDNEEDTKKILELEVALKNKQVIYSIIN